MSLRLFQVWLLLSQTSNKRAECRVLTFNSDSEFILGLEGKTEQDGGGRVFRQRSSHADCHHETAGVS